MDCSCQRWVMREASQTSSNNSILIAFTVALFFFAVMFAVNMTGPLAPVVGRNPSVKQFTIYALDKPIGIAENVTFNAWTFNGSVPGPVVRVTQGDTVELTLVNSASIGHSIDFHASQMDWKTGMRTIAPGESLKITFVARFPGVFMYHCGTPPVLHHIANGMYGMIVVDPANGRAAAREYFLVQSEFYANEQDMLDVKPRFVVFNGQANQYVKAPLEAVVGELVRLYVVNAGPTLFSAFHVIGTVFETVQADGNPANVLKGIQTYTVPPGGGGVFEFRLMEPGFNPFVTHAFAYTGLGAVGLFEVKATATQPITTTTATVMGPVGVTAEILNGAWNPNVTRSYSPDPMVVVIGVNNTVLWVNKDLAPHTVTATDKTFDSGNIDPGKSWRYTFTQPGTYSYYCLYHPWMKATLIVKAG